jgi:hypothetical protein
MASGKSYTEEEKDFLWRGIKEKQKPRKLVKAFIKKYPERSLEALYPKFKRLMRKGEEGGREWIPEEVWPYAKEALRLFGELNRDMLNEKNKRCRQRKKEEAKKDPKKRQEMLDKQNEQAGRYRKNNRDHYNAYHLDYYHRNQKNKKRINASRTKWEKKNKKRIQEKGKVYYLVNQEKKLMDALVYAILNKDKIKKRVKEEREERKMIKELERIEDEKEFNKYKSILEKKATIDYKTELLPLLGLGFKSLGGSWCSDNITESLNTSRQLLSKYKNYGKNGEQTQIPLELLVRMFDLINLERSNFSKIRGYEREGEYLPRTLMSQSRPNQKV